MLYRLREKSRERFCHHDTDPSFPLHFIEEISTAPTRDKLLSVVAQWLPCIFPAHRASLALQLDDKNLTVVIFDGKDAIPIDSTLPIATSAAGQAFLRQEIWITSDTRTDDPTKFDLQLLANHGLHSCINVPLIMAGKCFGCLNLGHQDCGAYDHADIPKFRALAFWIASQLNHYESLRIISAAMQRERLNLAKLDRMAKYDYLTGLLNRHQFTAELMERMARAPEGSEISLLYLDLDGFKAINDTFGHVAGDKLLKMTGERITANVRSRDLVTRLGGDEFVVAIGPEQGGTGKIAHEIGARLVNAINNAYEFDGHVAFVSTSIGIRVASTSQADLGTILRDADLALYQAKRRGGSGIRFFDDEIGEDVRRETELANDLMLAIERNQFELHYQPIVNATDQHITSCEALLRWRHPVHGYVPPARFIATAESSSFIASLGEWVLRTACMEAASWPPHVSVSVNVSPRQFLIGDFVAQVVSALQESGLQPGRLQLEITETVILNECKETNCALEQLQAMGVCIVLDDFGTGYASFNYLKQFQFKKLKIDKSLIDTLGEDERTLTILEAVVKVAKGLSIGIVAEGVETEVQHRILAELGCDELQGYLFSKPLPRCDMRAMLTSSCQTGEAHEARSGADPALATLT
ncbi:MAG TPA: EAL domain-containing protein [Hyphomicrobiaceae bacterium]|nr:EAL domain-containing protein [Hyphomicrobiaceae bacterium]